MLEVRDLRAPKDIRDSEERAAERAGLFLKSRLKRLSDKQAEEIERKLDKWYTAWAKQTKPLRNRLVRYADLMEGVVEDSNVPFEGASNITLHYAAGIARTFRATFNKTAYQDQDIFFPILSPDLAKKVSQQPELLAQLDEGFNYSFWGACNGLATMKEGTVPCVRDGTLVISGRWHREVRRCFDQRIYRSLEEFQKDYPNAEETGGTEEEYRGLVDFFLAHPESTPSAEGETPQPSTLDKPELIVGFEYDHLFKDEPEYRVGPWAKFVRYPLAARILSECQFYGYQIVEDRDAVKLRAQRGEYYKRGVQKSMDSLGNAAPDDWDKALGFVEGITPPTDPGEKPLRPIEGCCLLDLDNDGIPEKYQVKYDPDAKALLSLTPHRLRRGLDASVVFRMIKRENRLDGVSLIGDCEDLFNQIDFNARHRNNVRILTTSPVFFGNSKYKDQIDLGRAENVIRPGVTYWVDDIDKAFKQMQLQDLSTTMDNVDELKLYKEHVELVFGPTQGLSGMSTPQDPRAPARKTQLLMMQANGRIDDYLDQFMEAAPELAQVHAALLFQFADGPELSYSKGNKALSLPLKLLSDPGLTWGIKRRSVQLTPEFTMARLAHLQGLWLQLLPRIAVNDPIAVEIWNRQVESSGEPQKEKFLLSGENLQKVQQSFQAAMQANPQSADNKAQAKGKEAFHKEIGKTAAQRLTGQISPALS